MCFATMRIPWNLLIRKIFLKLFTFHFLCIIWNIPSGNEFINTIHLPPQKKQFTQYIKLLKQTNSELTEHGPCYRPSTPNHFTTSKSTSNFLFFIKSVCGYQSFYCFFMICESFNSCFLNCFSFNCFFLSYCPFDKIFLAK